MAEDLRHFLTALDVKSLDVLGFSIGGTIAQSLVLQYPELALSDIDLVHGIISINKARVSGIDRDKTKTSEDRRVQLCPRALSVLRRHLRLRASLGGRRKDRPRSRLLPGDRRAVPESAPSSSSMAQDTPVAQGPLQAPVHGTPNLGELELDGWQERALGRQATWPQHCDHAARLRGMAPPVINLAVDLSVADDGKDNGRDDPNDPCIPSTPLRDPLLAPKLAPGPRSRPHAALQAFTRYSDLLGSDHVDTSAPE
jgi:pimeloyl-ACP methyl ester carboxylesterase